MSKTPFPNSIAQLLWFVRVVDAGSFAEAARRAGVTTSALSKAITRFEQAHGVRLLHRSTHSLSLTMEGDRLLAAGKALMREIGTVEETLADVGGDGAAGRVKVSAPASFGRLHLVPAIGKFLSHHPHIKIELSLDDDVADLAANGIDFAVRTGTLDHLPGLVSRKFSSFAWIVCAAPEYLAANGTPTVPEELKGHRVIAFRNRATGQIDNWNLRHPSAGTPVRYVPQPQHTIDDGESAWQLIRSGLGIGWAPSWLGPEDLRAGRVVEVMKEWRGEESALLTVRLDTRHTPKRTRAVMDMIHGLSVGWKL
jgi:DNA-binding transcriptional LysR family regulator